MHGSEGERKLQLEIVSSARADKFYDRQMRDCLTETMQDFVRRQEMVFVATADARGNCDCSPRFGKPRFVDIIDEKTIAYPEFRGNGVFAGMGNIIENPHIGLVFVDFLDTTVGLHVNGTAQICRADEVSDSCTVTSAEYESDQAGRLIERWVVIRIDEAYIHCSKHVPRLKKVSKQITWGTDDGQAKSNDFFQKSLPPERSSVPPPQAK